MSKDNKKIAIIGGGLAGLAAATELHANNREFTLFEASSCLGGKLKTHKVDGYKLDLGFQVLLDSYPSLHLLLQKLKITNSIEPCYFDSGALLLKNNKTYSISDPLQEGLKALDSLLCPLFSLQDKLRLLSLRAELQTQGFEKILKTPKLARQQSIEFLREYEFSENLINDFMKPFFGGVFGDNSLCTSAANLEFCFKAFSEKRVFIPAKGVAQFIDQISKSLPTQSLRQNTKVVDYSKKPNINKFQIKLFNGEELSFDTIIFALDLESLCELMMIEEQSFKRQKYFNLYFKSQKSLYSSKKIFLNCSPSSSSGRIINNGIQISNVSKELMQDPQKDEHLISTTVLRTDLREDELIHKTTEELKTLFPQAANEISFLTKFCIESNASLLDQSPENLSTVKSIMDSVKARIPKGIFLAGEHTSNICSQETSIKSGFEAAQKALEFCN